MYLTSHQLILCLVASVLRSTTATSDIKIYSEHVQVHEGFFGASDIQDFENLAAGGNLSARGGSSRKLKQGPFKVEARLSPAIIGKLPREQHDDHPMFMHEPVQVGVSCIHETTHRHKDRYVNGPNAGDPIENEVAIIFLNTNDDAKFVHGGTVVPVVKGDLVKFSADTVHNTVVQSGEVRFVGPIDLRSLQMGTPTSGEKALGRQCDIDLRLAQNDFCTNGFCDSTLRNAPEFFGECAQCPPGLCIDAGDCAVAGEPVDCGGFTDLLDFGPNPTSCPKTCGCTNGGCQADSDCLGGLVCSSSATSIYGFTLTGACLGTCEAGVPTTSPAPSQSDVPTRSPVESPTQAPTEICGTQDPDAVIVPFTNGVEENCASFFAEKSSFFCNNTDQLTNIIIEDICLRECKRCDASCDNEPTATARFAVPNEPFPVVLPCSFVADNLEFCTEVDTRDVRGLRVQDTCQKECLAVCNPTNTPSSAPSDTPSTAPSNTPSIVPSTAPSNTPSNTPSTSAPTNIPTKGGKMMKSKKEKEQKNKKAKNRQKKAKGMM